MLARTLAYVGVLLAQNVSPQVNNEQELEKLQGDWVIHSSELKGKDNTPPRRATISIKGN